MNIQGIIGPSPPGRRRFWPARPIEPPSAGTKSTGKPVVPASGIILSFLS